MQSTEEPTAAQRAMADKLRLDSDATTDQRRRRSLERLNETGFDPDAETTAAVLFAHGQHADPLTQRWTNESCEQQLFIEINEFSQQLFQIDRDQRQARFKELFDRTSDFPRARHRLQELSVCLEAPVNPPEGSSPKVSTHLQSCAAAAPLTRAQMLARTSMKPNQLSAAFEASVGTQSVAAILEPDIQGGLPEHTERIHADRPTRRPDHKRESKIETEGSGAGVAIIVAVSLLFGVVKFGASVARTKRPSNSLHSSSYQSRDSRVAPAANDGVGTSQEIPGPDLPYLNDYFEKNGMDPQEANRFRILIEPVEPPAIPDKRTPRDVRDLFHNQDTNVDF